MRKQRLAEVRSLPKGHLAKKWQIWKGYPDRLAPKTTLLTTLLGNLPGIQRPG
jgi:hypothetical protein